MKRNRIILVLGVVLGVLALIGCPQPTDENEDNTPTPITDEFQVYWLNIAEADLGGLEGFHIKNLSQETVGIVIDRIVASNAKDINDASVVDVLTFNDPEVPTDGNVYWSNMPLGNQVIADGALSTGEVLAPSGEATEVYIGGFATPAFVDKTYVGIVAKNLSSTVKKDKVHFVPIIGNPVPEKGKNFEDLFIY